MSVLLAITRRLRRKFLPPGEIIEGYEKAELVETIFQKTKAYNPPQGHWPLVAAASTVLDFGGGCGLHYKLAQRQTPDIKWAVVETPAMSARAAELATDRLRFFVEVGAAAEWLGQVDVMHSNGALQYVSDPLLALDQLCALKAKQMIWHRLLLSSGEVEREIQSSFLGDNGPGARAAEREKIVKYERTRIPERAFLAAHRGYKLADRGPDWAHFEL